MTKENFVRKSRIRTTKPKKKHTVKDTFGNDIDVRSKLEVLIGNTLTEFDVNWVYEKTKIKYVVPESNHVYTVDFTVGNGILLEGKGILADHKERTKYVLLKEQNPDLDLRFIFDDPQKKCGGMKMTHAEWATKFNFKYCGKNDKEQILSWIREAKKKNG